MYKKYRYIPDIFIIGYKEKDMINTGDQLMCINGNPFFVEGDVYIVGNVVNKRFFEILIDNDDHWYATKDSDGIYVRFNSLKGKMSHAWFVKVQH